MTVRAAAQTKAMITLDTTDPIILRIERKKAMSRCISCGSQGVKPRVVSVSFTVERTTILSLSSVIAKFYHCEKGKSNVSC